MYFLRARTLSYLTVAQPSKLTLICCLHLILTPHSSFASCPNNDLCSKMIQFKIMHCIQLPGLFNLLQTFPSKISLIFMTLILSKITGWLFCRVSPTQGFSGISHDQIQVMHLMEETLVREDPLEKEQATHSSILGLPLWLSW